MNNAIHNHQSKKGGRSDTTKMKSNNDKRIVLFLATEKGYTVLRSLLTKGYRNNIAAVVSFHELGMERDFFVDIQSLCMNNKVDFYNWIDINKEILAFINSLDATGCIAISWRYMLPLKANEYLDDKIIIFHDSLLPKYRGFAPLVSAMINGDETVGMTVLYASAEADCGDIIIQKSFAINDDMHIKDVIYQMSSVYAEAALELMESIVAGPIIAMPQDDKEATYSIWRDEEDYRIDWRWSARKIRRCVHALGYPYKGAKTMVDQKVIRIKECELVDDKKYEIRTPGKICSLSEGCPVVICGEGLLKIKLAEDEDGFPYKFDKLRIRMV